MSLLRNALNGKVLSALNELDSLRSIPHFPLTVIVHCISLLTRVSTKHPLYLTISVSAALTRN